MRKISVIHNILWSHYKAVVFSELYKILDEYGYELKVIQIAVNEKRREGLGDIDLSMHNYPYELRFEASICFEATK